MYLLVFTRQCVRLAVFQVLLCSLKGRWYERLTHERTFLRWFREVHVCPLVENGLSHRHILYAGVVNFTWGRFISLPWSKGTTSGTRQPCSTFWFVPLDNSTSWTVKRHFIHWWGVFYLGRYINNSQNVHTWSHENPHETHVTNFQRRFSVNVLCGVLGNRLIGPFVFDNNLTGNEAFLRNELPGLFEDMPLMLRSQMYF